jgi:hypothetical protein
MAKEHEHSGGGKKRKLHLASIHTHRAQDGGFVHEHYHEDDQGNRTGPHFGGVSTNLDDLQQHMTDHFGPDTAQPGDGSGAAAAASQPAPEAGAGPTPEPQ